MSSDKPINNLITGNFDQEIDVIAEIDTLVNRFHTQLTNYQLTKSKIVPYTLFISDLQMAKTLLESNGIFASDLQKIKSDYAIFADNLTSEEILTLDKIIMALNTLPRLDPQQINDVAA